MAFPLIHTAAALQFNKEVINNNENPFTNCRTVVVPVQ